MRNAAPARNIVLVGPMGSGKSHVGRLLATRLGLAFVDLDARIEAEAGKPISAIFASEGEQAFRVLESRVLAETMAGQGQVVATGGGAVLDAGNRAVMRERGHVVYLQVEHDDQWRRIAGVGASGGGRPLLDAPDPAQRLRDLQAVREPLYREAADLLFDTGQLTAEGVADALAATLAHDEEFPA